MSLKKKAVRGIFWSLAERVGLQATNLISSIVLARLLSPIEFGVVGIVLAIVTFFRLFIDFGLRDALVRKPDATEGDYSAIFLFNMAVSLAIYLLLFVGAEGIASFYSEPRLANITKVLGLNVIVMAGSFVQSARLTKKIDFQTQFVVGIVSSLSGLGVGVYMALTGYGVWAIVFQNLAGNTLTTLLFWIFDPWVPSFNFKIRDVKSLLQFGSNLFLSGLVVSAYNSLFSLLIGKFNSARDLGLYTKARSVTEQQIATICSAVQRVSYPVFSEIQSDDVRLRRGYQKVIESLMLLIVPIAILGFVFAQPVVKIVLSEKWIELVPYFKVFCLSGLLYPFHSINLNIIKVKGKSYLFLGLEIAKFFVLMVAFLFTFKSGLMAIVLGQLGASVINLFLNSFFSGQLISYPLYLQFKDIARVLIAGLLLFFLASAQVTHSSPDGLVALTVHCIIGTVAYFLFCLALQIDIVGDFNVFFVRKSVKE